MTNNHTRNDVVVGVDGSTVSGHALDWAARDAALRRARLHIVHAYTVPVPASSVPVPSFATLGDELQAESTAVLDRMTLRALEQHPHLDVTATSAVHRPVDALLDLGQGALITVVGMNPDHHLLTDLVFGTVATPVAARSHSPVVVVRPPSLIAPEDGPILVGLDGSADSDAALSFALEEASFRGRDLIALHVWNAASLPGYGRVYPQYLDTATENGIEQRLLAEQLAGWSEKYPDVTVHPLVYSGDPTQTLLDVATSRRAGLTVVGSRGHNALISMLLGSTSRRLLAHAPGTVAVVREPHHG